MITVTETMMRIVAPDVLVSDPLVVIVVRALVLAVVIVKRVRVIIRIMVIIHATHDPLAVLMIFPLRLHHRRRLTRPTVIRRRVDHPTSTHRRVALDINHHPRHHHRVVLVHLANIRRRVELCSTVSLWRLDSRSTSTYHRHPRVLILPMPSRHLDHSTDSSIPSSRISPRWYRTLM